MAKEVLAREAWNEEVSSKLLQSVILLFYPSMAIRPVGRPKPKNARKRLQAAKAGTQIRAYRPRLLRCRQLIKATKVHNYLMFLSVSKILSLYYSLYYQSYDLRGFHVCRLSLMYHCVMENYFANEGRLRDSRLARKFDLACHEPLNMDM